MATANTLAALDAGAVAADVAVNGLGGRAGNAALEEIVMAAEQLTGLSTGVNTRRLRELSAFVEQMTGIANSPLKPIVGRYCFAHAPVMHVRCIAGGNPSAFEPFDPQLVGAERTYSFGLPVDYAGALEPFLRKGGVTLSPEQIRNLLDKLRSLPDWSEAQILKLIHEIHG
jgi:homocitrate synthase NifV